MPPVIPHRFLFRYSVPVRHVPRLPKKGKRLLDLPAECTLPDFSELDGSQPFGQVRVAWNARGLGISVTLTGKSIRPSGSRETPTESDGLQVWIDTRNTQSIHRAGRFCHHFCLLPAEMGPGESSRLAPRVAPLAERADDNGPIALQLPIARAREETPLAKSDDITIAVEHLPDGYTLEAWLPAEILNGFDPEASPQLGFYYYLRDAELGEQFLTVGRDFPFAHDPSLWSTLELVT
jgi:hypothetical protein